ncbi:hypothetical protein EMCRGX_G003049 [Ephydatia muelleri]
MYDDLTISAGSIIVPQLRDLPNNSMAYVTYTYFVTMGFPHSVPVRCELLGGNPTFRQWYQPNGSAVPTVKFSYNGDFGQVLTTTGVDLYSGYKLDILTYLYSRQQGVHRCVITDEKGITYQLCVGLYLPGYTSASDGPTIPDKIQLSLLTAPAVDPPVFQLNCTSTRSPATIVKWTINGSTAEGGRFASYQILKDPVSSTYENILVVTGNVFGLFVCNVTTWIAPDIYHRSSAQSTNASLFVGGIGLSSSSISVPAGTITALSILLLMGVQLINYAEIHY